MSLPCSLSPSWDPERLGNKRDRVSDHRRDQSPHPVLDDRDQDCLKDVRDRIDEALRVVDRDARKRLR
jgi:hypothetical protein